MAVMTFKEKYVYSKNYLLDLSPEEKDTFWWLVKTRRLDRKRLIEAANSPLYFIELLHLVKECTKMELKEQEFV